MRSARLLLLLISSGVALRGADFLITDHGARPGQLATTAIQQAVDACHQSGGGRVVVPAGRFITGTIVLRSHVELHLSAGAELVGSADLNGYLKTFRTHGVVFAEDAVQVSVTGEGTIDAGGTRFFDPSQNHTYEEFDRALTRQKAGYMPEGVYCSDGPIKKGPKPGMTLAFFHCSQVVLRDFTLKDTPSWAVRLAYCDDVLVDGLSILNNLLVPNSDGVHITTSRNVRIANCDIRAGDDAIIVTGFTKNEETPGYTPDEQAAHVHGNKTPFAENINVANCQLQSRSSGIRIGYGQHPIRRCVFSNLVIHGSNRGIGIFARDAADISELVFTGIIIETRLHNGQWWGNGEPIHLSAVTRFDGQPVGCIRDVQFDHIIATGGQGILLYGARPGAIEGISFDRVRLKVVAGPETLAYGGNIDLRPAAPAQLRLFEHDIPGLLAQEVDGLALRDFSLKWGPGLPAFFTHGIECVRVRRLAIDGFAGGPNPAAAGALRIRLEDTTRAE